MANAGKYGTVEIEGVPEDEPVFILRAQDVATPTAVRNYAEGLRRNFGPDAEAFVETVFNAADEIEGWQRANIDKIKQPD